MVFKISFTYKAYLLQIGFKTLDHICLGKIGGLPVFPPKEGGKEEAQKPSWLEELSRKQANR